MEETSCKSPFILRSQLRESRFFQNYGTFNTNQNKKYHNFERNEIRAAVFLKWTDFSEIHIKRIRVNQGVGVFL